MTKVEILETFTGFPDGTEASSTRFEKGATPELQDEFAELVIGKRHARKISGANTSPLKVERPPKNEGASA